MGYFLRYSPRHREGSEQHAALLLPLMLVLGHSTRR